MRKKISLILLICITIYMGGYHLIYAVYQQGLKQEMKSYIRLHPDADPGNSMQFKIVRGHITDSDFSWEEEGVEFRYKNAYYDVVSMHRESDSIYIRCLKDGQENQLQQKWQAIHPKSDPSSESPAMRILKCFSCFVIQQPQALFTGELNSSAKYATLLRVKIPCRFQEMTMPPPRSTPSC